MVMREGAVSDLPYRSPITPTGQAAAFTTNEANYDTLKIVREILDVRLKGLSKDFNAFDILKVMDGVSLEEAGKKLMVEIMGKQVAYDILIEAQQAIDSAMKAADEAYKRRNNQS